MMFWRCSKILRILCSLVILVSTVCFLFSKTVSFNTSDVDAQLSFDKFKVKLNVTTIVTPILLEATPPPPHLVLTKELYEPGFIQANPQICKNYGNSTNLVVMITSSPNHFKARQGIRMTWGNRKLYNVKSPKKFVKSSKNNDGSIQNIEVAVLFVIGRTTNETINKQVNLESEMHKDLIIGNSIDSYYNLTLKTMSSLEWLAEYCRESEFALKTDDDMFINVPNLLNFINVIKVRDPKSSKIYGRLGKKWPPRRNKRSKWYISRQQYDQKFFPDFTTGPAYLFSSGHAKGLLEKGLEHPYIHLEDVFTTGIIAEQLGIPRRHSSQFLNKPIDFKSYDFCNFISLISIHQVNYDKQFYIWEKLKDNEMREMCYNKKRGNSTTTESL